MLFLGEGKPNGPARYLLAVARWARINVIHRPDGEALSEALRRRSYGAIILSDYRYKNFRPPAERWLVEQVAERGTGLLMIGGWASFTGLVGGYAGSRIERLLPVRCRRSDDRVNRAGGAVLEPTKSLAFKNLNWKAPPVVCGYHRAAVKPGATVRLWFRDLHLVSKRLRLGEFRPGLVTGRAGRGRTAAFLTDCAPHWAGGLVDWGRRRVRV